MLLELLYLDLKIFNIREILKAIENDAMISFAGGLPNPKFFPVEEIERGVKTLADFIKELMK